VSSAQAKQLAEEYVPWDRERGRRAFARKFCCSVSQFDYWLAKMVCRDSYDTRLDHIHRDRQRSAHRSHKSLK
jgi:hypothetical protein